MLQGQRWNLNLMSTSIEHLFDHCFNIKLLLTLCWLDHYQSIYDHQQNNQ